MFNKLSLLTWLELKVYLRDPAAIFWTFFFPFLLLVIFMAVNSQEGEETFVSTRVTFVESGDDKLSRHYIHDIEAVFKYIPLPIETQRVKGPLITEQLDADQLVIQLPEHFDKDFKSVEGASIVIAHAAKPNRSTLAVISIIESLNEKFNIKYNKWKLTSRIEFAPVAAISDAQTLTTAQYLTTGLIGMTILSTCLFGFAVVIVQLRASNAFKIYQVLPITPLWYFGAFIVSRLIVMIVFSLIFVVVADLMYTLDFDYSPGNLLNFIILVAMGAITFLSIGILLASRTSSASTAMGVTNIIYFPMIFLSGLFFPLSSTLEWVNVISAYLPLKEYVEMFRAIMFAQGSYIDFIRPLVLMLVWTTVALAISHKTFVWNNKN